MSHLNTAISNAVSGNILNLDKIESGLYPFVDATNHAMRYFSYLQIKDILETLDIENYDLPFSVEVGQGNTITVCTDELMIGYVPGDDVLVSILDKDDDEDITGGDWSVIVQGLRLVSNSYIGKMETLFLFMRHVRNVETLKKKIPGFLSHNGKKQYKEYVSDEESPNNRSGLDGVKIKYNVKTKDV